MVHSKDSFLVARGKRLILPCLYGLEALLSNAETADCWTAEDCRFQERQATEILLNWKFEQKLAAGPLNPSVAMFG